MYNLPKVVRESRLLLKKWSAVLKMGKQFPRQFKICSAHFTEKEIMIPTRLPNKQHVTRLVKGAFPSLKLPMSSITIKRQQNNRAQRLDHRLNRERFKVNNTIALAENTTDAFGTDMHECQSHIVEEFTASVSVQAEVQTADKSIQADMKEFVSPSLLWDTDRKLNTMTGIPKISILNRLTKICQDARQNDDCFMPMKDRILLTMYKLKNNSSFAHLAIWFQVCDKTAKLYFADTIQLLAKVTQKLIHWQSREQNLRSYPKYFEKFPNVRTVLDCTEFKTVTFQCLTCRTCTYSHYKGTHTLKLLIGVSPSGLINYISKVATGKSSDKAIFNISGLLGKLEKGDVVMVDKGFLIADELAKAGVELVRPEFFFNKFSKEDVDKNTYIASARVHVERRIARLKVFKVLSDKVDVAVLPYIDYIISVLSGLSNMGPPILADDKF